MKSKLMNICYALVCGAFILSSCQKNEFMAFHEDSGLNFDMLENSYQLAYNFAFQSDPKAPEWDPYYYGDSLLTDTLELRVSLVGELVDEKRAYFLKLLPQDGPAANNGSSVEFLNPYYLDANQLKDTIQIGVHRPANRETQRCRIGFDTDNAASALKKGVAEQAVFSLEIKDQYSKPMGWDEEYWGAFSAEKYAFFITHLHFPYSEWDSWRFEEMRMSLIDALRAYNQANPTKPKDFTFPGY